MDDTAIDLTDDTLDKDGHKALGDKLKSLGLTDDDVNALNSKDLRRARIREIRDASLVTMTPDGSLSVPPVLEGTENRMPVDRADAAEHANRVTVADANHVRQPVEVGGLIVAIEDGDRLVRMLGNGTVVDSNGTGAQWPHRVGDVLRLDDRNADRLIEQGKGVEVDEV